MSSDVWSERDTSPGEIADALRELLVEHHNEGDGDVPARVLNLVALVDREWRGEVENRLDRVGRFHPSRTVLLAVEPRRTEIDARADISSDDGDGDGEGATRERVVIDIGERHLRHVDRIVDPLVVTDLPTMVWSPHGHDDALDVLMPLAQIVLFDSVSEPDLRDAITRARELAQRAYVVDLAWLRSTPWRERVAGAFDPPDWRSQLGAIAKVSIRHHPESAAAGALFLGWLCSRLDWKPGSLGARGSTGAMSGRARSRRQEVELRLDPDNDQSVPGLSGITIETARGESMSLDRGSGGLRARRVDRRGNETEWTIIGASRGEAGILGEGIRQALLRDPTYRPALEAAEELVR